MVERGRVAMRVGALLGMSALVLAACSGNPERPAGAAALPWQEGLDEALAVASAEGKLVMVDFYTDWCVWCRRLEETTLADEAVRRELARAVLVRLDAERGGRAAASRYGVEGYPTVLFLDARGEEVARIPGYLPPGPFLEELRDVLAGA